MDWKGGEEQTQEQGSTEGGRSRAGWPVTLPPGSLWENGYQRPEPRFAQGKAR